MTSTIEQQLGTALATDYFLLREQFDDAEWELFLRTRRFVDEEVLPVINDYWERAEFPWPLARRLAELGLVRDDLGPLATGLVHMEVNRGDGSLGTFFGVQTGLAMKAIAMLGSREQQERWLDPMSRLEKIGAFALTEPDHGSDSVALETTRAARRRRLGARRRQALDRQRHDRRRRRRVGTLDRGRPGQGLPRRDRPARLRGGGDRGQGQRAGGLAGGHPARRACACPRPRGCRAPRRSRTPAACS